VPRDLFRREPARDEPEDLDLPVGQRKAGTRARQQDAARYGPTDDTAERHQRRSAKIHDVASGRGLRRRRLRSARPFQRATILRADDLVLEPLQEELSATARAKRLLRVVPHRGLTATGGIRGPELLERRSTGAGWYEDLPESMSTEVAIKLSTNSHVNLQPEPPQERCQGVPCSHYPETAVLVPLIGTQNWGGRMGGSQGVLPLRRDEPLR
jgi:hypothetical protein